MTTHIYLYVAAFLTMTACKQNVDKKNNRSPLSTAENQETAIDGLDQVPEDALNPASPTPPSEQPANPDNVAIDSNSMLSNVAVLPPDDETTIALLSGLKAQFTVVPSEGKLTGEVADSQAELQKFLSGEKSMALLAAPVGKLNPEDPIDCSILPEMPVSAYYFAEGKVSFATQFPKSWFLLTDPTEDALMSDFGSKLFPGPYPRVDFCLKIEDKASGQKTIVAGMAKYHPITPLPFEVNDKGLSLIQEASQSLGQYTNSCTAAIEPIPDQLDCHDGTLITTGLTGDGGCTHPQWLEDSCAPFVMGKMIGENSLLLCRRKKEFTGTETAADLQQLIQRARNGEAVFDDVAIIQHNPTTGDTCWFQALGPRRGKDIPHPAKESGNRYWYQPASTAEINCIRCHDNGPWMNSPFIRQAGFIPEDDVDALYNNIGTAFATWPKPKPLQTDKDPEDDADSCISCHRLTNLNSCSHKSWLKRAVAWSDTAEASDHTSGFKSPAANAPEPFMCDEVGLSGETEFNQVYKEHIKCLLAACDGTAPPECSSELRNFGSQGCGTYTEARKTCDEFAALKQCQKEEELKKCEVPELVECANPPDDSARARCAEVIQLSEGHPLFEARGGQMTAALCKDSAGPLELSIDNELQKFGEFGIGYWRCPEQDDWVIDGTITDDQGGMRPTRTHINSQTGEIFSQEGEEGNLTSATWQKKNAFTNCNAGTCETYTPQSLQELLDAAGEATQNLNGGIGGAAINWQCLPPVSSGKRIVAGRECTEIRIVMTGTEGPAIAGTLTVATSVEQNICVSDPFFPVLQHDFGDLNFQVISGAGFCGAGYFESFAEKLKGFPLYSKIRTKFEARYKVAVPGLENPDPIDTTIESVATTIKRQSVAPETYVPKEGLTKKP